MLSDSLMDDRDASRAQRLARYHLDRSGWIVWLIAATFVVFIGWAIKFQIDEVTRANGEVIASSRVQIIQSVDGGVIRSIQVREGDRVQAGQVIAELDETRVRASVGEMRARLAGLLAKATRLRAEVTGKPELVFPPFLETFDEQKQVELALFEQRRDGLKAELANLTRAVELAQEDAALVARLQHSGDVNRSEVIRTQRAINEAENKLLSRRNRFFEDASEELTTAEDEMAQTSEVLTQRQQQLNDSVFRSKVDGIVKNVRVTTIGGVLRAGEELMQIVPVNDELIVEAKISPTDISRVEIGQLATVRFDPFDYTIYGGVEGSVVYVSADTLKEESGDNVDIYYRVHVRLAMHDGKVRSLIGRQLEILPGMTARVDIRAGERSLMEYLLKPLRKTLTESLGER
ncbi:HlyD family type I secretion periplasmic adaptor subunit [Oceanobacter sp. 4_MG-2023]|uniref:HlyD family type I secretion periplasmic adaptor subunit n=1 Tax=Oceanobacter sp. 4_MG-2023 TaxID=3062623 RepID=UPI0027329D6C|nr:HlyD family type I secretion periplasmic adaptor subunit [Oceanobacter sp. 4_MG-2023]MDP2548343.1 HlyD family type I secretion periplasmic adaptor subunit [Oceanobacter sp. 4_MG-2023]